MAAGIRARPTARGTASGGGRRAEGRSCCASPSCARGSYFPSLPEPRRQAERALLAVGQPASIQAVSTRKVDELVQALGLSGVDKSAVSRICRELDGVVEQLRQRPLAAPYPYLWLAALYLKVRQNHRRTTASSVKPS